MTLLPCFFTLVILMLMLALLHFSVFRIIFGLSLVFTLGAALRRGASKKLAAEHSEMTEDFLKRLLENRQSLVNAGKKELGLTGTNATKERKAKIRADNQA